MFYLLARAVISFLFKFICKVEIVGEAIPQEGPLIIVSNHQSIIDPFVLMTVFPKKINFLAAAYLFKIPIVGKLLALGEAMPINSKKGDFKSLKKSFSILRKQGIIGIFPEGGVSLDGKLKPFMPGWAYLALKSGSPVVPVAIKGTREILPVGKYVLKRGNIKVVIGKVKHIEKKDKLSNTDLIKLNQIMEQTLLSLLNQE